ncbi:MAG TPA: putative N-acetylmannosamine-6-phosphate 2-epimerase [Candidatus Lustribacter sp.]|jgi:N-acylglucosamine-6-phosphate 2-epimerase|nr:putative N-acetylmannosamine-6-phosphate 2-epimerase [Candidatus Lustribacter sp.]
MLDRLRGLIVSIQPNAASVLNTPETVALLARCAVANGAAGVRIEGVERIAAVRRAVDVPIVGLIKRAYPGFDPYITATEADLDAVAAAGADVVAFDATARERPGGWTVANAVAALGRRGLIAMADCATAAELGAAAAAGAQIVATTLCGYTADTRGAVLPALDLLPAATAGGAFAILEGGVASPDDVRRAFSAGASAVVVGTAISDIDAQVRRFAQAAASGRA